MKLRNIGTFGDYNPISVASTSYYNKAICRQYYIPINLEQADNYYWYAEFPGEPDSVEYYCYDVCTEEKSPLIPENFIVGTDTNNDWYTVINGVNEVFPCGEFSQIGVKAIINGEEWWWWSEIYQIIECGSTTIDCKSGYYVDSTNLNFDTVYSCYNANDNGGFDDNDIYLGKAVIRKFGNRAVRYYHNFPLRNLRASYSGTILSYTSLNNRPTKTQINRTYTINFEAVPYWYEQQFSNAFAKGVVTIAGQQYTITDYSSISIGDPCCERVSVTITAQKTSKKDTKVVFSCSTASDTCTPPVQDCNFDVIAIPPIPYDCTLEGLAIANIDCTLQGMSIN